MAEKLDEGKKRKRHSDDGQKSSKKIAIEGNKIVKLSFPQADKWAPVIGLSLPSSTTLQPYTKSRQKTSQSGGSGAIDTTEFLLHSSEYTKLDYIAREEELGVSSTLRKHYVGVYDPEAGKLEVVEARKMVVRGAVRKQQPTKQEEEDEVMAYQAQRLALGETFGTKKAKKQLSSFTENAVGPARVAGAKAAKVDKSASAILATMADAAAGMATRDQLAAEADAAKPRPKANLSATDIKDVYTIDNLIGTDIFKHIGVFDWSEASKNKKAVIVNSRYVAARIEKVVSSVEKLKVLRYLYILIEFYAGAKPNRASRRLPKREDLKKKLGNVPEAVVDSIKRRFSTGSDITPFQVDLLLTHIAALACIVDSYEVDMWDLRQDLDLDARKMQQYFQEIGAKIASFPEAMRKALEMDKAVASQRKIAKLRLPLEFPKVSFGRKLR
ncbi:RNA polymerase I associated factor, A49-like protein [Bisporella sp. PMI_857]|nr:RNA polymerase I associated factor, A49-like protein [Bisporella sp. PMI_857]